MRRQRTFALALALTLAAAVGYGPPCTANQPNIVVINIDDMGWGDFAVYGSQFSQTPNIDQLATEGTRFTQFYSGSPICSPSRAALFTGQYASRSGINTFLNNTGANLARDTVDHLALDAPSMAQTLKDGGYATGHFGKWHLGGGRDVGYAVNPTPGTNASAPRVVEYGFDEAWTQFEGLGNRILNVNDYGGDADGVTTQPSGFINNLNSQSNARGTGGGLDQIVYLEREYNGTFMMNRAIEFFDDSKASNATAPVFLNLWMDEVHTPHDPSPALKAKYDALYPGLPQESRDYLAVLEHVDQEIGRLVDHIDNTGHGAETLFLVMADNGADETNVSSIGSSGPFTGIKGSLYEGGVRSPLIARWTGSVAANRTDSDTVMWTPDLLPTLTSIAGVTNPDAPVMDGENLSDALLGVQSQTRTNPLFWNFGRGTEDRFGNGQEAVALRSGDWKLVMRADVTGAELFDLSTDLSESNNVAAANPSITNQLASEALAIRYDTPARTLPTDFVTPVVRLKAEALAGQGDNTPVSGWADTSTGDSFNGTVTQGSAGSQPSLQTDVLNGRAVVEFDGDDVLLSSTNNSLPSAGEGITAFAVLTGDSSGATAERFAQLGDNGGAGGEVVGFDASSSATGVSNGGAGFRFNNGASLYDTPIGDPGFHIVVWQVDGGEAYTDATLFVDGTLNGNTFTGASNNPTGTLGLSGNDLELLLGTGRGPDGSLQSSDSFTGQLAEFLVYNDQLTVPEINLVANYLSTEYDLPFAYETSFNVLEQSVPAETLVWLGGVANFDSSWNSGDGAGLPAPSNSDPFSSGGSNLFLGGGGEAILNAATDASSGTAILSLQVGSGLAGVVVAGAEGDGTFTANDAVNLTVGDGVSQATGSTIGDLYVGESNRTGTVNWNSSGTLDVQGKLRVGNGGVGVFNQNDGVVQGGTTGGALKYLGVGDSAGGDGVYNLNDGALYPDGQGVGSTRRQLRVGHAGATGQLNVGDGIGAVNSAIFESEDDLWVGASGGDGTLVIESDGVVRLEDNNAPLLVGHNDGSGAGVGTVVQNGGTVSLYGLLEVGNGFASVGEYHLNGGTVVAAGDGAGDVYIGSGGGSGRLRVQGDGGFVSADSLWLGETNNASSQGTLELVGSQATIQIAQLANDLGADETIRWVADSGGVTPLVVTGVGSASVQLQDPSEVGGGDGVALELDLSALSGDHTLVLIDNRSAQSVTGRFEIGDSQVLYGEGDAVLGSGFTGFVTISYAAGAGGNDVVLTLESLSGDFNNDGVVDAADFAVWRDNVGSPSDSVINDAGDDVPGVSQQDYLVWAANYGRRLLSAESALQVPEPTTFALNGTALLLPVGMRNSYRQVPPAGA